MVDIERVPIAHHILYIVCYIFGVCMYISYFILHSVYDILCKALPRCPCFGNWKGHRDAVISGPREAAESARPR